MIMTTHKNRVDSSSNNNGNKTSGALVKFV